MSLVEVSKLRDFRGPILVVYIEGGGGVGGGVFGGGSGGGGILGPGYILTPWPRSSWFEAVKAIINRFINNCTAGRRVVQFVHISANLLLYGSADLTTCCSFIEYALSLFLRGARIPCSTSLTQYLITPN